MADSDDEDQITVRIEYAEYLTRLDLHEILDSLDSTVSEIMVGARLLPAPSLRPYSNPFDFLQIWREPVLPGFTFNSGSATAAAVPPFFRIKSFGTGSVVMTGILSVYAATTVLNPLKRGVDSSNLRKEIERLGRVSGDVLSAVIAQINAWGEDYVARQRASSGNVTSVTVARAAAPKKRAVARKEVARKTSRKKPPKSSL